MEKRLGMILFGLAFELLGLLIGAVYLGRVIDSHFGWKSYALMSLIIICMLGWLVHLIHILVTINKNLEEQEKDS